MREVASTPVNRTPRQRRGKAMNGMKLTQLGAAGGGGGAARGAARLSQRLVGLQGRGGKQRANGTLLEDSRRSTPGHGVFPGLYLKGQEGRGGERVFGAQGLRTGIVLPFRMALCLR